MKDFFRTVKSEFRRIFSDRKLMICTLAVLVGFIVIITVYLATEPLDSPLNYKPNVEYCRERYEYFREYYLYLSGATTDPPFIQAPNYTAPLTKERMQYFAFMIENNGEPYRFVDLNDSLGRVFYPYSRGGYAQIWIMQNCFYALILVAVLLASLICIMPYASGVMKNYYASPIKRSTLFAGKLTTCWLMCFVLWLIVFVWGMCFGAVGEPIRVLHYDGDNYSSYNLNGVFVTKMAGALIAMLFVSAVTVLAGNLTNKSVVPPFIIVAVCVLFAALFEARRGLTALEKSVLPVIGLRASPYIAVDAGLWIIYIVYLLLAVVGGVVAVAISGKSRQKPGKAHVDGVATGWGKSV